MKTRKTIIAISLVLVGILSACNDNPCANGSACGMLDPHGSTVQAAVDYLQDTAPDTGIILP